MQKIILFVIITLISSSFQGGCKSNKWSGAIPEANLVKFLNDYNLKRQTVANGKETGLSDKLFPESSNMAKVFWNKDLAKKAQDYADSLVKDCKFAHNPDRKFGPNNIMVGENLYSSATSKTISTDEMGNSLVKANVAWWAEKKDYDTSKISPFVYSSSTGHFTQMAWADSNEVGCGYALYENDTFPSNELVVCNYIPAGNFMGEALYRTGKPCSECGTGKTCNTKYPGLCGGDGIYIDGTGEEKPATDSKTSTDATPTVVPKDNTASTYLKVSSFVITIFCLLF